jgi:hypothetical protein
MNTLEGSPRVADILDAGRRNAGHRTLDALKKTKEKANGQAIEKDSLQANLDA